MGEVVPLFNLDGNYAKKPDIVSPELSIEAAKVYQLLAVETDSTDVVISPGVQNYDAYIHKGGVINVGRFGLADFKSRFKNIELDPEVFYVNLQIYRNMFKEFRNTDPVFHKDLLEVAGQVRSRLRFTKLDHAHAVEAELLGYKAADIALIRSLLHIEDKRENKREKQRVKFAAFERSKLRQPRNIVGERQATLGNITLELSGIVERDLDKAVMQMVRRRQKQ